MDLFTRTTYRASVAVRLVVTTRALSRAHMARIAAERSAHRAGLTSMCPILAGTRGLWVAAFAAQCQASLMLASRPQQAHACLIECRATLARLHRLARLAAVYDAIVLTVRIRQGG